MSCNLFSDQAESYAQYRPTYPPELYEKIYVHLGSHQPFSLAVDCATGNGQAATALAEKFEKVLAFDVSEEQVSRAAQRQNIEYRVGAAEDIPLADHSVDLITVAQAVHWFDLDLFLQEAHRVLRPGGVLAIWGGKRPEIGGNQKADKLLADLILGEDQLFPLWDERVVKAFNGEYATLNIPETLFQSVERTEPADHAQWPLKRFLGYMSTWSAHAAFKRVHPDRESPLVAFKAKFMDALGAKDDDASVPVVWPNFLIIARARH